MLIYAFGSLPLTFFGIDSLELPPRPLLEPLPSRLTPVGLSPARKTYAVSPCELTGIEVSSVRERVEW